MGRSQNPESKLRKTRDRLQHCSSQDTSPVLVQPLTNTESTEKAEAGQKSRFETNWLSSSHPFVSVCLSMEEVETLDLSRETMRKSQTVTHLTGATHLTEVTHLTEANHLTRLSSTLSPTVATCPLLFNQKGDMVFEQEEEEEQDTTDKVQKTIVEQYAILAETNATVLDIRVDKTRRKRAREEASKTILDSKKKRPRVSEREDICNLEATTETPMSTGFSKIRRAKRKKGRITQDIKIKD